MTTPTQRVPKEEINVYGINACKAVFKERPDEIFRVYLTNRTKNAFSELMRFCVEKKLPYHIRPKEEFEKITQSTHHEEVCLTTRRKQHVRHDEWLKRYGSKRLDMVLAVDGVDNPHNLGSLMRICANYGVKHLLTEQPDSLKNPSAMRTAEGGGEQVVVIACRNICEALGDFRKAGYRIISTSSHAKKGLDQLHWPMKAVLVLGSESVGVRQEIWDEADVTIRIPGTEAVESLNVSSAASILCNDWYAKKILPPTAPPPPRNRPATPGTNRAGPAPRHARAGAQTPRRSKPSEGEGFTQRPRKAQRKPREK
ncbi:MAG: TrmH family RNA methyltransferase [Kiritimatiellae bacterium]|nr:TrmH family RNA methyltransferase [Kiritimatiellia bacterium]MDD4735855.1 TrmH family RNA methyltransferase [Kiritimatiellia bacterium]